MQLTILFETFDGHDLFAGHAANLSDAGTRRLSVDKHGARAALTLAASVLAARQVEIVAQHAEQTRRRIYIGCHPLSVDVECGDSGHKDLPCFELSENRDWLEE